MNLNRFIRGMTFILRMQRQEEPEIATVGSKGQIVIPLEMRKELRIAPKSKLAIYRRNDKLVITRLKILPMREQLSELLNQIDKGSAKRRKKLKEREILKEIQAYRQEKRK